MNLVARCVALTVAGGLLVVALIAGAGALVLPAGEWPGFLRSLSLVAALLVPSAAVVTRWFARDLMEDLDYVAAGVDAMMRDEAWGRPVPIRSRDEVGEVTRRFDALRRHYLDSLERARDARRRAEEADRDKTEFLNSVSHELRNPLNSIVGFTDVLLAEMDGPLNESQREDLELIRGAGGHLVSLFNEVLDLSAAASGHLRIEKKPVALGEIVRAVGAELRGQRGDRPVTVEVSVSEDLPQVCGDATRLRQVVTNLATNALKFTESGAVTIEVGAEDGEVVLRVRDTGPGIPSREIPLLFAEFGQMGDAKRRMKGTGLGLAISKQLVELHGGRIDVESEEGVGSTFSVHLPPWRST